MSKIRCDIIVCQCCMLAHANGECCADQHDREPLSKIGPNQTVTMGDSSEPWFSWQGCEGCGSPLGGDRYTLTLWDEDQ
jgi:hypothetical protein